LDLAQGLQDHLQRGEPTLTYKDQDELFANFNKEMRFLTAKPVIYVANVDEEALSAGNEYLAEVKTLATEQGAEVITICASLEQELIDLPADEKAEYLLLSRIEKSGLTQLIGQSYSLLDLISYFSMNENEVRAWTIRSGWTAPRAAGVIHTDFERGFIRAEVLSFDDFVKYGSSSAARAAGALRIEGKDYVVCDGDVIYFRFNVS
jgi:ribosome-binding ATPase YchF (GTP1/OBG family)